jgi:hypothetical protein
VSSVSPLETGTGPTADRRYIINFNRAVSSANVSRIVPIGAGGNSNPSIRLSSFIRLSSTSYLVRFTSDGRTNFCREFNITACS